MNYISIPGVHKESKHFMSFFVFPCNRNASISIKIVYYKPVFLTYLDIQKVKV